MLENWLTDNFKNTECIYFLSHLLDKYPSLNFFAHLEENKFKQYVGQFRLDFNVKDETKEKQMQIKFHNEQGNLTLEINRKDEDITIRVIDELKHLYHSNKPLTTVYEIQSKEDASYSYNHKIYAFYDTKTPFLVYEKQLHFDSNNEMTNYVDKGYQVPSYQKVKQYQRKINR